MNNNRNKVASNLIWRFAERITASLVTFIVSIFLARILAPSDYGTVALITVFITILNVFVDSGLGTALIQKKNSDELDFGTVFISNMIMCIVLYVGLFFSAPLIASFYNDESLISLTRVLGITVLVSGLKNILQAYVAKNLIFKKFFFATLFGTIVSAVVGLWMAYNGFGVWSLVAQTLTNNIVDTLILVLTLRWIPKLKFSFFRFKTLFSYGWKLLVSALLDTGYNELRQLVIGKMYTSSDLAYYNKGRQFPNLIVTNINTSIDSVLLPTMSKAQDDSKRIKEMTKKSISISSFIMAPMMLGLAAIAGNFIPLLLTDKWIDSVIYLQIFCVIYMFYPIHTANLNAIKAMGRSDMFLKLEIAKKVVGLILLLSFMWLGPLWMAISLLIGTITGMIINSWPNKKLMNYSLLEQLKDIGPSLICAGIMFGVVFGLDYLLPFGRLLTMIIQVFIGIIIYFLLVKLFKLKAYEYTITTGKSFINKKLKIRKRILIKKL